MRQHIFNTPDGILHFKIWFILPVNDNIILKTFNVRYALQEYFHHFPVCPEIQEFRGIYILVRFNRIDLANFVDRFHETFK